MVPLCLPSILPDTTDKEELIGTAQDEGPKEVGAMHGTDAREQLSLDIACRFVYVFLYYMFKLNLSMLNQSSILHCHYSTYHYVYFCCQF